jgi:hypothetical protein
MVFFSKKFLDQFRWNEKRSREKTYGIDKRNLTVGIPFSKQACVVMRRFRTGCTSGGHSGGMLSIQGASRPSPKVISYKIRPKQYTSIDGNICQPIKDFYFTNKKICSLFN